MKLSALMLAAALATGVAGGVAQAQPAQGPGGAGAPPRAERWQPDAADRAAMLDARLAALKAGLKLTPEQEKLWPPVEKAVREDAAKRQERMEEFRKLRAERKAPLDVLERLKLRADRMTDSAADLKRLIEAVTPLHATLDDAQKRRLGALLRFGERRFGPSGSDGKGPPHGMMRL
ncbi:MAG: Spy/CpxP family protein refolding chaperone [Methylacidiphilales bacterium]|nr:Spy/CpxP family protein refolding chaperone [Candidatus Methylacidiphilales bacterium]